MTPIHFGALAYSYQAIDVIDPFDLLSSSSKFILKKVDKHIGVDAETGSSA